MDASVALNLTWHETDYATAVNLFDGAREGRIKLMAPDFWLIECANACWKRVGRGAASAREARDAFKLIQAWPVLLIDTSTVHDIVLDLALENQITSYDALYVATAQFANAPLITTDTKLLDALRAASWTGIAKHLSEWS